MAQEQFPGNRVLPGVILISVQRDRYSCVRPVIPAESGIQTPGVPGAVGLSGHDTDAGCFHFGSPQVPRRLLLARADGGLDSRFRGNDG